MDTNFQVCSCTRMKEMPLAPLIATSFCGLYEDVWLSAPEELWQRDLFNKTPWRSVSSPDFISQQNDDLSWAS